MLEGGDQREVSNQNIIINIPSKCTLCILISMRMQVEFYVDEHIQCAALDEIMQLFHVTHVYCGN